MLGPEKGKSNETTITFAELTKQVHLVKDLILSDMICGHEDKTENEATNFAKHLWTTKSWFSRISWANKKRYTLALLEDVRSAWALSCILKSIWNCRPKDAVLSSNQKKAWSSYDQVPMDHNRTALPVMTLAQVMKNDRIWFMSLEPQAQALVLLELLTLSGGPVMWLVLKRATLLYERYFQEQLHNLQECIVLNDHLEEKTAPAPPPPLAASDKTKKDQTQGKPDNGNGPDFKAVPGLVQKELEANLAVWYSTIKAMRDSLKLEELEMSFKDGTKRKIWKVNRPKPEAIETVDFIQLLPSEVAKIILSYLPRATLADYARVNKYWAYLVEEYRYELATQLKLEADFEKLQELMLRHDTSYDVLAPLNRTMVHTSFGVTSAATSAKYKPTQPSMKASEKSAGAYSFRHLVCDKLSKPILAMRPIPNLTELSERLERRGAADENIWNWCENILKNKKYRKVKRTAEGVLPHDSMHFPMSTTRETVDIPLRPPLFKDPAANTQLKPKRNISNATVINLPNKPDVKRYSLWTKDFSSLYPVYKIPSHQLPN